MFERRLKIILAIPILCSAAIVWRLYELQIVRGPDFVERMDTALLAPRTFLPPLRGQIRDRYGRTLVSDEPAHDVTIHYGALSMNEAFLSRVAGALRRQDPALATADAYTLQHEVHQRIARMWLTLERVSGIPLMELRRRRDGICRSVENLRLHIWEARKRQGFDEPVAKLRLREEEQFHPILYDVPPAVRTRIEIDLSNLPLVRIEPSVRRVWQPEAQSLCHVLGRLGQVSSEQIENDPWGQDRLAGYRPGDLVGVSGVERLGEAMLRGKRGYEERYLDGRIRNAAPPIDGLDVQLTIDLDLQQRVTEILVDAVAAQPPSTGASCVLIDIESREVVAMVSVPTFDPEQLRTDYARLRDDTRHVPLRFRAVGEEYQPGSILKPVSLLAGLAADVTSPAQTVFCDGSFIPGSSKWHCWTHWRGMAGHGDIRAEEAIQHSCNVYFYWLGQKLGAARLTGFYRSFLLGPVGTGSAKEAMATDAGKIRRGTGLIEERSGIIPDRAWIRQHARRDFRPADGRNYSIGQGEIQITPLQAAEIFATLAAGHYRESTLIANDHRERPALTIPGVEPGDWALVRRGLYRCVNEEGGTAYKYVHMHEVDICGKTGSAQCVPRVTRRRYTFELADGTTKSIVAPTIEAAREALEVPATMKPVRREIVETWPPRHPDKGEVPTHAWFAGYAPYDKPSIAMAVVIEYGGGGGATAGPAARAIFEELLRSPRGYLTSKSMRSPRMTSARP